MKAGAESTRLKKLVEQYTTIIKEFELDRPSRSVIDRQDPFSDSDPFAADPIEDLIGEARRCGELLAVIRLRKRITIEGQKGVEMEDSVNYPAAEEIRKTFQRGLS